MSAFKKILHGGQDGRGWVVVWGFLGWLCLFNVSAWGQFSGGSGTLADPYLISDPNDLQAIGLNSIYWDDHFKLTVDLDMTGVAMTPIGHNTIIFTGTFNGNGHTISNLTIKLPTTSFVGLFGVVRNVIDPNTIYNLGLIDPDINGNTNVGALVGWLKSSTLSGCTADGGSVDGIFRVGGLVGWKFSGGTINNCTASVVVDGSASAGGLVGVNRGGTISDCTATGAVSGIDEVGGLVGFNQGGTISACTATGQVNGTTKVGGLEGSGEMNGTVINCTATGAVSGTSSIGGLVGNLGRHFDGGTVINCTATGAVSGGTSVGGLVGSSLSTAISHCAATGMVAGIQQVGGLVGRTNSDTIINCYAIGPVTGMVDLVGGLVGVNNFSTISKCYATGAVSGPSEVGGLVGENNGGTISSSFWDKETGDPNDMCGAEVNGGTGCDNSNGKTTAQMQTASTFTDAGWDFVGESANGVEDIWRMCLDGVDYPRLRWEYVSIGDFGCPDGVGMGDWVLFTNWWGATNCTAGNNWCEGADFNHSGAVDWTDALVFFGNWLEGI